jgi:hypothetical protein
VTVEAHFWEDGVNETGLDRIALLVSEKSMVEGIGQCWFVVYLKNQISTMSLHGSIGNSSSYISLRDSLNASLLTKLGSFNVASSLEFKSIIINHHTFGRCMYTTVSSTATTSMASSLTNIFQNLPISTH